IQNSIQENSNSELAGLVKESSGFEECDQENIQDWLESDADDAGYQELADDEIIGIVIVIDDQDSCNDEEDPSNNGHVGKGPSSKAAFTALRWL
ncbi:hypothetical protein AVEN_183295-2-1, partial [Araneus ventricosus]